MTVSEEKRVLRIGVVRDGHLVLERRFRRGEDIVVGRSRKCTLQLPGEMVPDAYRLFTYENGQYYLRFAAGMAGTVSVDDVILDLEGLKESGKAVRTGDAWVLPLRERDRGKVTIADVEVLFQVLLPRKVTRRAGLRREGDWGNPLMERLSSLLGHKAGTSTPASAAREKRVLRVGVVREDQILQERLLREAGDVTVGRSRKCTLELPVKNAPESYRMFLYRKGRYYLRFTEGMAGKVSVGDGVKDLATLRESGVAQKSGNYYLLPLSDTDRGKLVLGDVSLLFQFVIPPRPVAAEELAAARGGLAATFERVKIWATLASTGKQARTVQTGLWLGLSGAVLSLLAATVMPWLEEYTVDLARAGWSTSRLHAYGWGSGQAVIAFSAIALIMAGIGITRSTKKLFSFFALVASLVNLVCVMLTPFVIRGAIRALIANGTLIPMTQLSTDFGYQAAFLGAAMMVVGFIWGLVAQPVFGPDDRVLRLVELWQDTPIREAVFPERRDITVGIGGRADFVLPIRGGKPIRLFRVDRHGDYWLALLDVMRGELFIDGEKHPVEEWANREGAKVGGTSYVQVTAGDWGRLEFGRVRLAFEFVRPPKAVVGRRRAMAMDGTLISTFIATSFVIAAFYVVTQFLWNPAGQMEQRKAEKREIKVAVTLAQEQDAKKLEIGEGDSGSGDKGEAKFGSADDVQVEEDTRKAARTGAKREETAEERSARLAREVKGKTILQFLDGGPGGTRGGPMTAVTGMGNAFEGTATSMVVYQDGGATGTGLAAGGGRRWGGAGGMAATPGGGIQRLARSEVPGGGGRPGIVRVATDEKVEEAVKIRIGGSLGGQTGSGKIDRASVESVFRRRKGAIQDCYERALRVNPNAAGKVTIRFTIGTGGTVTSIDVADNSTGDSGIGACIIQKVRTWPFPASEEGEVTFVYPFVLTSGG